MLKRIPRYYQDTADVKVWRWTDLALVLLFVATMILSRAHAPTQIHQYAQLHQIRASIDHHNGGSWILPKISDAGNPARKPQLYAWILSSAMYLVKACGGDPFSDWVFRIPTFLAAGALGVLIYLLGLRWYNRRVGLLAGGLWASSLHMNKLMYLATTDMLLAVMIGLCVFTVDRLTFHPVAPKHRGKWAIAFWLAMILAAITKGWGVVNIALVGGWLFLAGCLGQGFGALQATERPVDKFLLACRLILRRLWILIGQTRLLWGLAAMLLFSVALWAAMLHVGGDEFVKTVKYELVARLTGEGKHVPHRDSMPSVLSLYYNTLPASIFAGCAFFLVPIRRWLGRKSPIALPVWWIVTVVLAFSVPAGFRADYLLPCYAAVALLGAWAIDTFMTRAEVYWDGKVTLHLRRICQATPIVLGAGCILIPVLYFVGPDGLSFSKSLAKSMRKLWPAEITHDTWVILAVLPVVGLLCVLAGVWAIRRRKLQWTAWASCVAMMGILFCNGHLFARAARYGDGESMKQFALQARSAVGKSSFLLCNASSVASDVYLGRFGKTPAAPGNAVNMETYQTDKIKWLIVTDLGLLNLGAYSEPKHGTFKVKVRNVQRLFMLHPGELGRVACQSPRPIHYQNYGTIYLIERTADTNYSPRSKPLSTGYIADEAE